jgi:hypothetical protein
VLGDLDGHPPALPLAPRMSTFWPGWKSMRLRNAIQDDIAGFITAATAAGSTSSGSRALRRRSMTVRSAMLPNRVSGKMK